MRNLLSSVNWNKKDTINSRSGMSLQKLEDNTVVKVTGTACIETDETDDAEGEIRTVTCFRTDDEMYLTTISPTVYQTMEDVNDLLKDELEEGGAGFIEIRLKKMQSKGGRTFLSVQVL